MAIFNQENNDQSIHIQNVCLLQCQLEKLN